MESKQKTPSSKEFKNLTCEYEKFVYSDLLLKSIDEEFNGNKISQRGRKRNIHERRLHDNFDEISIKNFGLKA